MASEKGEGTATRFKYLDQRSSSGAVAMAPPTRLAPLAVAPTHPSLRSEVFKPCVEDKDLAFCLNEGECSIIETVAGVHRHCRW
ncbi:unnamed protein product, partial [Tetraodon nigroviridis]